VDFDWAQEADHVIQRADGSFIYHLANVVDDHDFAITHVIRAEEHLSNTPRQVFIAEALGYPLPAYAHLPYVAEPGSKRKLSKRKLDAYLKNPDFAEVHRHGDRPRHRARDLQPGGRRFLRAGRLPARRDRELPGAARLVAGRQDRDHDPRADDRGVHARAREPRPGQLRSRQAGRVSDAVHARAAGRREGARRAPVPREGGAPAPADRRRRAGQGRAHRRGAGGSPEGGWRRAIVSTPPTWTPGHTSCWPRAAGAWATSSTRCASR